MVTIKESEFKSGWVGLYTEDEDGILEESLTLSKRSATNLMNDIRDFLSNKAKGTQHLNKESPSMD